MKNLVKEGFRFWKVVEMGGIMLTWNWGNWGTVSGIRKVKFPAFLINWFLGKGNWA